jgi:4-amino-4-deoxy-L-arabinose transferase-like glycosyltransferase
MQDNHQNSMELEPAPWLPNARLRESQLSSLLVGLAIAAVALATLLAIQADHTPPYWDQAWYMAQGLEQLDALRVGDLSDWFAAWTTLDHARPSLVPLLTVPFYLIFGRAAASALYLNALMLSATMLFVYLLGWRMIRPAVGLAAALLVAAYPLTVGLTRILLVETTLTAMVALALLALWASEGVTRLSWSIVTGIALGLGLLTKVFFPVFVAAPVAIVTWQAIVVYRRSDRQQRRALLRNALLMLGVALAIAGPWYAINAGPMVTRSMDTAFGVEAQPYGPANPWHAQQLAAYLRTFATRIVAPAGFALFVLGAAAVALNWRRLLATQRWAAGYLLAAVGVTYAVFTSLNNQDPKHISAILPAVALLSSWGITLLLRTPWPTVLVASLFLAANLLVAAPQSAGEWAQAQLQPLSNWLAPRYDFTETLRPYAATPASLWPLRTALDYALYVADIETLATDQPRIGIIPNAPAFEEHAFRFEALRSGIEARIGTANLMNLDTFDLLLDKTGDAGIALAFVPYEAVRLQLAAPDSPFAQLPRTFALPDGSDVLLYSRRPSPLVTAIPVSARPLQADFGAAASLLAIDVQAAPDGSSDLLDVTTYWETHAPTAEPLSLFLHLLESPDGAILWQGDHLLFQHLYPSTWWQGGAMVKDTVQIPPGVAQEGTLFLRLGLYTSAGRLPVTVAGEAAADAVNLTWRMER